MTTRYKCELWSKNLAGKRELALRQTRDRIPIKCWPIEAKTMSEAVAFEFAQEHQIFDHEWRNPNGSLSAPSQAREAKDLPYIIRVVEVDA